MSDNEKVGYGHPPKKWQFQKGKSGNPKGRPKEAKSLGSVVKKQLGDKVQLLQNGKPKKVSKMEALVMRLVKDALEGKPRAQTEILKLAQFYLPEEVQSDGAGKAVAAEDQALVDAFVKRMMKRQAKEAQDDQS